MLFFDPILSGSKTHSCATCHNPALSWGDGLPKAVGEKSHGVSRADIAQRGVDAEARLGRAFPRSGSGRLRADHDARQYESDRKRMLIERLSAIPGYVDAFDAAFGEGDITKRKVELALATFERTIVSGEAPFDRWIKGDETAIDARGKTRLRSVRRQGALRVVPQRLGLHRFFVPRHRHREGRRSSDAASCFRLRSSCITPSRRRRCATSRAARPTCMTVRCRRSKP